MLLIAKNLLSLILLEFKLEKTQKSRPRLVSGVLQTLIKTKHERLLPSKIQPEKLFFISLPHGYIRCLQK